MSLKRLPVGIENFEKIRTKNFYYVDKTRFIIDLLEYWAEVNLFTRPRRFGKSLNMDMLRTFFEFGCKRELFDGLKISERKDLCEEYMGKFPVISISLKDISGTSFQGALASMKYMIAAEARRSPFLEQSDRLSDTDKRFYRALVDVNEFGDLTMSNAALENSLSELSRLLEKHYGTKVILLIDEYDVPLDQAFQAGYYDEMVTLIRNFFSKALKTNQSL